MLVHKGSVCASRSHTCRCVCAGVHRLCPCEWLSLHGSVHGARVCRCVQPRGAQVHVQSLVRVCVCTASVCKHLSVHSRCVCVCARVCASLLSSAGWSKPGAHLGHVHAHLVPPARGTERAGPSWCCVVARCRCPQRALRSSRAHRPLTEQWQSTCKARERQSSCVHTSHGCTPAGALP